jgi:hypothetical protein
MNANRCPVEFSNDTHIGVTLNDSIVPADVCAQQQKK